MTLPTTVVSSCNWTMRVGSRKVDAREDHVAAILLLTNSA